MKAKAEEEFDGAQELSMEDFAEDWNASQFWVLLIPSTSSTHIIDRTSST